MPRALAVVAHPDDETIWMGGTMLMHAGWKWAVLSLCRKDDADRAPRFAAACKLFGAKCAMSDLDDENIEKPLPTSQVKSRIKKMLLQKKLPRAYDFIFTHGANGEYGHKRHKEVARAVVEMVRTGDLKCKELWRFSYSRVEKPFMCVPKRGAPKKIALAAREARMKKYLITDVYSFSEASFEARSCSDAETFDVEMKKR
ncbi:MAG: PIG-L family deacetylase [Candidatus Diapherotrites archaeon]